MKYFRIIFSLIFLGFVQFSCSSDDDASAANEDRIIGEWRLIKKEENQIEIPLDDCDDLETYIFNADFSFRAEVYAPAMGEDGCSIANFSEGVWGTNANNQYFTNTSGTNFPFTAEFSSDENEMSIIIENSAAGIDESRTYQRQEVSAD